MSSRSGVPGTGLIANSGVPAANPKDLVKGKVHMMFDGAAGRGRQNQGGHKLRLLAIIGKLGADMGQVVKQANARLD